MLLRISASLSLVASSPAMMAAGSPGVRRRIANTTTATMAMTGSVASNRRAMYANIVYGAFLMFQNTVTGESSTPVSLVL